MNTKKPLILISNDDGYHAKGINSLIDMLRDIADIIVRLLQPKVSILEVMAEEHPELNDLINTFNLEQVGDVKFIKTKQTNKNAERREISGSDDQGVARSEDKA